MTEPRILHLGQVVVDLSMDIDHLPERGGDIFARRSAIKVGGGYNVIRAARQMGAPIAYMGAIGTGPMADMARGALAALQVPAQGPVLDDCDTGYSVAMIEPSGERTFVSTRGAETQVPEGTYESMDLVAGDVIYLSGYSFCHKDNTRSLVGFAHRHQGEGFPVLFDLGPMVANIALDVLKTVNGLHPIWSLNEREGPILAERLGCRPDVRGETELESTCRSLSQKLGSPVVLRAGARGAWYCQPKDSIQIEYIPTPQVHAIDTNGAGDTHSGVLCAGILQGLPIEEALTLANCAGALSTTQPGPATCPDEEAIRKAAASLQR
ncbi:carbohydrate kinase [Bifidobacterium sp. W8113]|uniref:PfkB family carbohydrate kinase n=1 Tax=Bifidobacterium choladohabitans TaxID=2750947 RepID=UPI0018DCD6A4|nr:PfkB family carbohydrate kinase [Bifidobacterium choladohabitans]MBI0090633.1 carbohydrate kinase [Bifidobacterium choladohabitans]